MKKRRCMACGRHFNQNPRVKDQKYCSEASCQKERKRIWQRKKRAEDPVYRANQLDAQERWRKRNPDYWREYRKRNPDYVRSNRLLQKERNKRRRGNSGPIAKMDASRDKSKVIPGHYRLVPLDGQMIGKMDSINVIIDVIPRC